MGDCNCKHGASGAGGVCVECDIPQLARNNYFTGKLLVERDFTDEQRYLMGKQRRHNQRLHGWGAVCGLKVNPHPTCPDRYVIVEPGTAIDCCGREILVGAEEYFGFEAQFLANWQKQNGPNSQPDSNEHKIQICVSYKECGTEDIPALFDDCSCDATSCQPNRILESYGFDVLIDPKSTGTDVTSFQLDWSNTLHFANAVRVAESDAKKLLYILTSSTVGTTTTATLYQLDTTDNNVMASATFANSAGLDVAVSPAGDFVYVAVQPSAAGTGPQITVFGLPVGSSVGSPDLTATVSQFNIGTKADATVQLGVVPSPSGPLLAAGKAIGVVAISGMNVNAPPPTQNVIAGITNPVGLAISPGGQYAYVADGSANVSWITLSSPPTVGAPAIAFPAGAAISSIAAAETTKGDTLAALDLTSATPALYFATIPAGGPGSATVVTQNVTGFAFPPMQVLLSPGGQWAYVLEQDTAGATPSNKGYVQVVNEHAVETNQPGNPLGAAMPVGTAPKSLEISQDGAHLYIPFTGQARADNGGVAVLDVLQTECCDLFQHVIDCPDCNDGNCIVLATINGYKYGQQILDANIDNVTDRHFLVSTTALTEVVKCLCDQEGGGKPGKDGAPGQPGPGLETGLTRISALSWIHAGNSSLMQISDPGGKVTGVSNPLAFVIAFTGDIPVKGRIDRHVFEIYLPGDRLTPPLPPMIDWRMPGQLCAVLIDPATEINNYQVTGATATNSGTAQGFAFIPTPQNKPADIQMLKQILSGSDVRVYFRGDFVLDANNRAICCEFVRAAPGAPGNLAFPTGEIPEGKDLGLEGGLFFSWFEGQGG